MPRMTSHAELLHHRPTNCHCNRVIQFPCACPSNYRLQLYIYILLQYDNWRNSKKAVFRSDPRRGKRRRRLAWQFFPPVQIDNRERRGEFLPKKIRNLFPESRDVRVITRPPVRKKESGQSLNRVFSFFLYEYTRKRRIDDLLSH